MKINELAKRSGVTTETIRKYRDWGLLRPVRNEENGYFDYTRSDFLNLLYIRKLRGSHVPIDSIAYTYEHGDETDILSRLYEEQGRIYSQMADLQHQLDMLQLTIDHLELYQHRTEEVELIDAFDAKYDLLFHGDEINDDLAAWISQIDSFTVSVHIPKETLLSSPLPELLPVQIGIGSYERILQMVGIPIPKQAVCCPKGKYATCYISMENTDFLPASELQPLLDFIRKQHLRIDSDTTAYLFRVDHSGGKEKFIYRLRVKVLPE